MVTYFTQFLYSCLLFFFSCLTALARALCMGLSRIAESGHLDLFFLNILMVCLLASRSPSPFSQPSSTLPSFLFRKGKASQGYQPNLCRLQCEWALPLVLRLDKATQYEERVPKVVTRAVDSLSSTVRSSTRS